MFLYFYFIFPYCSKRMTWRDSSEINTFSYTLLGPVISSHVYLSKWSASILFDQLHLAILGQDQILTMGVQFASTPEVLNVRKIHFFTDRLLSMQ